MSGLARYAGLIAAPSAWAASTQIGQITPYADCTTRSAWTLLASAVLVLVATAGAALSLAGGRGDIPASDRFVARMSGATGFVLTFALLLQAIAPLVIDPCLR